MYSIISFLFKKNILPVINIFIFNRRFLWWSDVYYMQIHILKDVLQALSMGRLINNIRYITYGITSGLKSL